MVALIDQLLDELARDVQDDAAARFDAMLRAMVGEPDISHMVETIEYESDIDDREFSRKGQW